jgi:hypothetical protein
MALVIHRAMRMRHIVICGLTGCAVFFQHYLISGTIFQKKKTFNTKCMFEFSLQYFRGAFLTLRNIPRDIVTVNKPSCQVTVILVRFQ